MPLQLCRACRISLRRNNGAKRQNHTLTNGLGPRPPLMAKPVVDVKHIRNNPGLYEMDCLNRNYPSLAKHSWKILDLYNEQHQLNQRLLEPRRRLKHLDWSIKKLAELYQEEKQKSIHDETLMKGLIEEKSRLLGKAKKGQYSIDLEVTRAAELLAQAQELALELPNLTSNKTPIGSAPEVLEEIRRPNTPHATGHEVIGAELGIIDIPAAAAISGWGFYYLKGAGALLEQALVQHAMSLARAAGFTPVVPPSLVYSHAAWACGFRPRDQGGNKQVYSLEPDDADQPGAKPRLSLAGTAEIPLAGLHMNHTFGEADLPVKYVGVSRSYRAEAGSRGKDTKGLYRVHEFTKVELFAWTAPDALAHDGDAHFSADIPQSVSSDMLASMLDLQRAILMPLNIPLRILNQPSTDLGASASIKYDIEGHFPSRDPHWGELSSLSNCTDYQSRRLNTRVRRKKADGQMGLAWPCTLNGTALAVPRVLAALLENNWDQERRVVVVPECLRKWMDGMDVIQKE